VRSEEEGRAMEKAYRESLLESFDTYMSAPKCEDYEFMLTISRDGETPATSIYRFGSAFEAFEAFNRYDNFGFAKNYLTVSLYEPNKNITTRVFKRAVAGECSYVRKNYIRSAKMLASLKNSMNKETYSTIVNKLALIFSQDNIRFDAQRFFDDAECADRIIE